MQKLRAEKLILIDNYNLEKLKSEFGQNKYYPKSFEVPIVIALSYFPELRNTTIYFVEKESDLAFSSRPVISSLFKNEKLREFVITFSTRSTKVPSHLLFPSFPLNAQVGILGHELSHTIYYMNKSFFQLMALGFKYLFKNFRINFERNTDKAAIERGLGFQLLDFARYTREKNTPAELIKWLNTFYLLPGEIIQYMSRIPEYANEDL